MDKAASVPTDATSKISESKTDSNLSEQASSARVPVEVVMAGADESPTPVPTKVEVVVAVVDSPEVIEPANSEQQPAAQPPETAKVEPESPTETSVEVVDHVAADASVAATENAKPPAKPKKRKIEAVKAVKVVEPENSPFEDMGLAPSIVTAVKQAGYTVPTPIQAETIPTVLAGQDLIGQAETGSGKTAAFALPLLSKIDLKVNSPQVMVLAPTRELAIQVTASFEKYGASFKGFRAVTIYGGQSYETQLRAIRRGVHVIVGTPGRMMDHIRQQNLNLSNLTTFVLDEADEMLRMGFIDDVEWIMGNLPAKRQVVLFSATMPSQIRNIANKHLNQPVHISIKSKSSTAESIKQSCTILGGREKFNMLTQILESEPTEGVIVFVKTRNTTVNVADQLSQRGFSAAPLNGEIPQNQRERTVAKLKSGRLDVLVATDVAARGLDVKALQAVINYELPRDPEVYVHRIGRTGRAGERGTALSLFTAGEQPRLKAIEGYLDRPCICDVPEALDRVPDFSLSSDMTTLQINAGRKQKLRPGDILGALTGDAGLSGSSIGKIDIFDQSSYVAVQRDAVRGALNYLANGKIKGRAIRARKIR
jgi:ATP-dependent RNA helicase DeaD